ncbi:MAG TPA: hypothetical protein DCS48_11240 [Desulfovibrio sp.]|nr:hypothetical protein [Desulfovibrio sp.]
MTKKAKVTIDLFRERNITPTRGSKPVRLVSWLAAMFIFALVGWSFVAKIPEVSRTRGQVAPRGDMILVQSLEGGQIVEFLVKEGQMVTEGQPLIRFEPLQTETDVKQLVSRKIFLELEAERLKAFVSGKDPQFNKYEKTDGLFTEQQEQLLLAQRAELDAEIQALNEQLQQKKQSLEALKKKRPVLIDQLQSAKEISKIYEDLQSKKVASWLEHQNARQRESEFKKELEELDGMRRVTEKEILEIEEKQKRVRRNMFADAQEARSKVLSELAEVKQRLTERQTSLNRLLINSPAAGIIKSLPFTTLGAVVNPSEILAEIVPVDVDLMVEVQISPREIGFIHQEQPVTIRIDTFDYARYGTIDGVMEKISPTTFTGPKGELYYQGEVAPQKKFLGSDPTKNVLIPGMTAEVDIITGEKTVFEYLLKPVFTLAHDSFTER